MATKTAAAKKKTTTTVKKAAAVKNTKKIDLPVGVFKEKCPEDHQATGKYKFFYALFACTTLIFAAVAVWLFIFSSELMSKYESIEACARSANSTCEVRIVDDTEE